MQTESLRMAFVWSCAARTATQNLEGATRRRPLWPNGTVFESVEFRTSSNGRELTQEELDKWVTTFPVETL